MFTGGVHGVGRFNDKMRNWLLLDQCRRAVVVDTLEMEAEINALPVRLAARRALIGPFARVSLLV